MHERDQVLAGFQAAIERMQLGVDRVEALEQRVELSVSDLLAFHERSLVRELGQLGRPPDDDRAFAHAGEQRLERAAAVSSAPMRRVAPSCPRAMRASSSGASVNAPSSAPLASSRRSAALTGAWGRR